MPVDPYLQWAIDTQYAYLPGDPTWLPILIKLKGLTAARFAGGLWGDATPPAHLEEWFIIPEIYLNLPAGLDALQYCTAWIRQDAVLGFVASLSDPDSAFAKVIEQFELSDPVGPIVKTFPVAAQSAGTWTPKVIVGMIDDGLPFANVKFREKPVHTRMEFFWDQDRPADLSKAQIDGFLAACRHGGLVDEDEVYRLAGYDFAQTGHKSWARRATHGAHVMHLACGLRLHEVGPDSPRIIGVSLPSAVTADPSSGMLEFYAFFGLIYILFRADQVAGTPSHAPLPVVVNLSYGVNHGPHDGTSLFERAVDAVTSLRRLVAPFTLVLAAGNSHLTRCHAHFRLKPGRAAARVLEWFVLPDDATQSLLEIWLPYNAGATQVRVEVRTPDGTWRGPLSAGGPDINWPPSPASPVLKVSYPAVPPFGARNVITFWLAPTTALDPGTPLAPSGTWPIRVTNAGATSLSIDSWIWRDDTPFGYPIRGRQSRFEDIRYKRFDSQGRLSEVDDLSSYIRRDGSINGIATGWETVVVGGCRRSDLTVARYSAGGPTPRPNAAQPPTRLGPDVTADAEWSVALHGRLATGTRSGSIVALNGTSVAAPEVTRWIAGEMARGLQGDRGEVGAEGAKHPTPKIPAKRGGSGRVDTGYSTINVAR